jgi:hypothetical protein
MKNLLKKAFPAGAWAMLLCFGISMGSCYLYDPEMPEISFAIPDDNNELLELYDQYETELLPALTLELTELTNELREDSSDQEKIAKFYAKVEELNKLNSEYAELGDAATARGLFKEPTAEQKVLQDAVVAARAALATAQEAFAAATAQYTKARDDYNAAKALYDGYAASLNPNEDTKSRLKDSMDDAQRVQTYYGTLAIAPTRAYQAAQTALTTAETACKESGARLPKAE